MNRYQRAFAARAVLASFLIVLTVGLAEGQTYKVEHLSTFHGYCWALYVDGNYAYVGEGEALANPGLRILDVSNPSNPVQVGVMYFGLLSPMAEGVHVSGGLAYIAYYTNGLLVADVSNPSAPTIRGSCDTPDRAIDVSVSGSLAYVADWNGGLQIIDVSNPDAPFIVGTYDTPGEATRLCVRGNLVYVADSGAGIQIIDVSNPYSPKKIGFYDTPVSAEGVFVHENRAYVADWTGGVIILDVSNPASPKRLGSCSTGPSAANLVVSGSLAYVACWESGLKVIDVSNPAAPKIVASYDTPGNAVRVAVSGDLVYLTSGDFHIFRVRMVDVAAPVITLLGDNPVTLEVGTPYLEPGYTATDDVDGDISANVVVTGSVDHTVVGIYVLSYNVSDSAGNRAYQKLRTIMVVDTTPPRITLLGDNPVTQEAGTPYVDAGSTATDNVDGDISATVVVTGSVDHTVLGSYALRYNVSDSSGNPAEEKTRTVNVVDTTPPVITLLGGNPIRMQIGTPYTEAGFTATDSYDGDITTNVVVGGSVDHNVLGTYTLRYNVGDSSGNPAEERTRTVNVVLEITPPVITLLGEGTMNLEAGNPYVEPGYSAMDDSDGDITLNVVVTGSVNDAVLGAYVLHYNVSDSSGNPAEEKVRTVNVVETSAPVITLLGENTVTLEAGTPYVEPGYSATDNYDGDITANVLVTGSVNDAVVGAYVLHYNVSDSSGNPAEERTRTVNVVDTTAPVIALLGENPMTLELGTPYVEPGYTATDAYDGDLTANVSVSGSVDHNTAASYTLHYDVADSSGNPAQQVSRVVEVVQTAPFEVVEVGQEVGGTFRLTWNSAPGRAYMIWSCDDLAAGIWTNETPEPIPSAGEITTWTDPDTASIVKFYRVEMK